MPIRLIQSLAVFGKALMDNPREVGAACPSSPQLARRIARLVARQPGGHVLELGAGTGAITHALLSAGVEPERLLPVERSARLTEHLRKRFPQLNVIHGDARFLPDLTASLPQKARQGITHVVSSLPLRSLPPDDVDQIMDGVRSVLGTEGLFIQYTYAIGGGTASAKGLHWCGRAVVWLNLPPARVDVFALEPQTAAAFARRASAPAKHGNAEAEWALSARDVSC